MVAMCSRTTENMMEGSIRCFHGVSSTSSHQPFPPIEGHITIQQLWPDLRENVEPDAKLHLWLTVILDKASSLASSGKRALSLVPTVETVEVF